jgi:hypothetical protein
MSWALFDLDDTLLDHDSFARFTVHLLRRNLVRASGVVLLSPLIAVLFSRRAWRLQPGRSCCGWAVQQSATGDHVLGEKVEGGDGARH